MNWRLIEGLAKNTEKQWYVNQKEVAVILGRTRQVAAAFLAEHSVPFYRVGKAKSYFLPEVLEAVEKTRWKAGLYEED